MSKADDPDIRRLREQLEGIDARILDEVNARIRLVGELRRLKAERGLDFHDPAREEWLLQHLVDANDGPLSDDGVRALFTELLALTKREL